MVTVTLTRARSHGTLCTVETMLEHDHNHGTGAPFPYEGLKLMAHCPLCQARYQPSLARIVSEKEDAYLLHVPCPKCHASVVALVSANVFGISSVGVLADLTSDEVLAVTRQSVTADDVLDLYKAFRDGSFAKVLTS